MPATEHSSIYLTWRILPRTESVTTAVRRDIDGIAQEVSDAMSGDVSKDSMVRALDPITRPVQERDDIDWAWGHRS
jgi:hypothetical protein